MKNIRYIIFTLLVGILLSCEGRETNLSYNIYGETSKENPRYSTYMFFIHLDSAYSKAQLQGLEDSIFDENKKFLKPLEIVYTIPNRHLNPENKSYSEKYAVTTIDNGRSETVFEDDKQKEETPLPESKEVTTDEDVIGRWSNEMGVYIMYKEKGVLYLENRFMDGSGNTETLKVKKRNGQTTYNVAGNNSEYMIIKQDGLYIYDSAGNLGLIYRND